MAEIQITEEMWQALLCRVSELENRTVGLVRLGPTRPDGEEMAGRIKKIIDEINIKVQSEKEVPPVDRSNRQLANGDPIPSDHSHTQIMENGQQKDYVVLSPEERAKGFVRPFRDAYRHSKCGKITTMGRAIAETYSRDPAFYSGTYCVHCRDHFPIGEDGEFTWYEMDGTEGPKVGL